MHDIPDAPDIHAVRDAPVTVARAAAAQTFHQLHAAFRTDADRLRTAVLAWSPTDRRARQQVRAAARWWRAYRDQLVAHHRVEDRVWFPALAARSAEFVARDEEALVDDHRYLDALLHKVDAAFARVVDPAASFETARSELSAAVAAVASLIADHFEHEERTVVPRIEQVLTPAEAAALGQRADREHSLAELRFLVPWFFDHLPPAERSDVLREAGWTMRVLYRATRPGYRRLVAAAGLVP